jgi:hypothetical protein
MSDNEMIGSEYPQIQAVIKPRLNPDENLLAFTSAVTTPIGNARWVPFVGSIIELGRAAASKVYILAVTNKRLLIIQVNKYSKITKELKEVAFESVSLSLIQKCAAESRFLDGLIYGDSFKLELANGIKYDFRQINKEAGAAIREAILSAGKS